MIRVKNDQVDFSVEEYKRPKFFVDYEKVQGTYRVGDTISITGFAKAYAGNNIDGAAVKYRVTRVARFLYPWMWWRRGLPSGFINGNNQWRNPYRCGWKIHYPI